MVDDGVEFGLHARHRVDHAGQGGHVEGVHHRRRSQLEADGPVHGRDQFVDGGDALFGVDEEPLPVHGHHLHFQGLHVAGQRALRVDSGQRAVGVELVGADPSDGAQRQDDEQRGAPDQQFELGGVVPVGLVVVGRDLLPGGPVPPGEQAGQGQHRHDDQQHQHGGGHDEVGLLARDVAVRVHHDQVTAAQQRRGRGRKAGAQRAKGRAAAGNTGGLHSQGSWNHVAKDNTQLDPDQPLDTLSQGGALVRPLPSPSRLPAPVA